MSAVFLALLSLTSALITCSPPHGLDLCNVCSGSNLCLDCAGVPFGTSVRDGCGVCNGKEACRPCSMEEKDACGVCFGAGLSCADCLGTPNGFAVYDICDVCNGDGKSCFDCKGVRDGTSTYDRCDVCDGESDTCFDCFDEYFGTATYDRCDVCNGNNACVDCKGEILGLATYDVCDVCDGDGTSCIDCAGKLHGKKILDRCGQCLDPDDDDDNDEDDDDESQEGASKHSVPCDEKELREDLEGRLALWVTVAAISLFVLFVLATLCSARFGPFLVWSYWVVFAFITRMPAAGAANAVAPPQQAPRRGAGGANKTVVFGVTILSLLSFASASANSDFHLQLCIYTNIGSMYPGSCNVLGVEPCSVWPTSVIECEVFLPPFHIKILRFDQLPLPFGGLILPSAFPALQFATSVAFTGRTDIAPLSTDPLLRQLAFLDFAHVDFAGFADLKFLKIQHAEFFMSGLPPSISAATALETLQITDSNLGGVVINEICLLTSLKMLVLIGTQLTGPVICPEYVNLANLGTLSFGNNMLSGELPDFSVLPNLRTVSLVNNRLVGDIDASSFPVGLVNLLLNHNKFTGVSVDWSALFNIVTFSVPYNFLSGKIPVLAAPPLLGYDISHNAFDKFGTSNYAIHNGWKLFDISYNKLVDPVPPFSLLAFPTGRCHFEHNFFCNIPVNVIIQQCTYSVAPDVCCASPTPDCLDCAGEPFGSATYDECDICNGDGNLCRDCAGTRFGTVRYDACNVCGGDSSTCLDCLGHPAGTAIYDACDVCNGDSSTCGDCSGAPHGPYLVDACGLCVLPIVANRTCDDCAGVANGTSLFDEFGVCNGDGRENLSELDEELRDSEESLWTLVALYLFTAISVCILACAIVSCAQAMRQTRQ
jgi:hypothetical protein